MNAGLQLYKQFKRPYLKILMFVGNRSSKEKCIKKIIYPVLLFFLFSACEPAKPTDKTDNEASNTTTVARCSDLTTKSDDMDKTTTMAIKTMNNSKTSSSTSINSLGTKKNITTSTTTATTFHYTDVENKIRSEAISLKLTKEVLERAIINRGNDIRVSNVIKKALRGEQVIIGAIGGSITAGSSATTQQNQYIERLRTWWKQTFPKSDLYIVNAGLGATDSLIGVYRADNHLLNRNPDLVIVEFSVNDTTDEIYKEAYEGLIRKILKQKNQPGVILLLMMKQNGDSAEVIHKSVGIHYNLPIISYKEVLWPKNGQRLYSWSEISPDSIHPNDTGHAILSELLIYYINTVRAKLTSVSEKPENLPAPITANRYENGELLGCNNLVAESLGSFYPDFNAFQFGNGWTTQGGNEPLVLNIKDAKNIFLLYRVSTKDTSGKAVVKLDGKTIGTLNASFPGGWGDYAQTFQVLSSDHSGSHRLEIQVISDNPKNDFWILGFLKS